MDLPFHRDEYNENMIHGVIRGEFIGGDVAKELLNESGEGDESLNTGGRSSGEVDAGASGDGGMDSSDEGEDDEGEAGEVHYVHILINS
jgi:hypothetical protein